MSTAIAILAEYRAKKEVKEMIRCQGHRVSDYTAAEIKVMARMWAEMHRDELIADASASGPRRSSRLLRDPGLAELQDRRTQRGAAGTQVVL